MSEIAQQAGSLSSDHVELWRSFHTMRRKLDRALDLQLQRDSGISASEYDILLGLNEAPERQLRIKDLAGVLNWEKSRVSYLVTRMERRGLLTRTDCEVDGRGSWIGLTADGRRAVIRATRGHTQAIRDYFFDVLTPEQTAAIAELSPRVIEAIGCASDEDAVAGDSAPAA
jgi:DNA-binding MarR family transcriptional regulator